MKTILVCFGTRPEAIKLAPLIKLLQKKSTYNVVLCATGQHRSMLDQALSLFSIIPTIDLSLAKRKQSLEYLSQRLLDSMSMVFDETKPHLVVIQGDTTTAAMSALSAYYHGIPVAHVEAGLPTYNQRRPFPEEVNRHIITTVADLHFAPTKSAADNLLSEHVDRSSIHTVGNTIVDALETLKKYVKKHKPGFHKNLYPKFILFTAHRRESFGGPMANIFKAVKYLAKRHKDIQFVYPVHLNPRVQEMAHTMLRHHENILLLPPVSYIDLLYLLSKCELVMTDSGGIQEEAPSFGKFVVVLRELTERNEGITEGMAVRAGTEEKNIIDAVETSLIHKKNKNAKFINPYGDGKASERIVKIIEKYLSV